MLEDRCNDAWPGESFFEYKRSYINFDFQSLGGAEVVTAASLGLYCKSIKDPSSSLGIWLADGNWEEYTITWNNQPGSSSSFFWAGCQSMSSSMTPTMSSPSIMKQ